MQVAIHTLGNSACFHTAQFRSRLFSFVSLASHKWLGSVWWYISTAGSLLFIINTALYHFTCENGVSPLDLTAPTL